jgi:hypothetical protein
VTVRSVSKLLFRCKPVERLLLGEKFGNMDRAIDR